MKYFISSILFGLALQIAAQQEINYSSEYKPSSEYNQVMEQIITNEITYIGSEEFLEKLKSKGVENPTVKRQSSRMQSVIVTEKEGKNGNFPFKLTFTNVTGDQNMLQGAVLYGFAAKEQMPKFDSIGSLEMDQESKKIILQTLQSTFSQMDIPKRKVKVGESFTIENPMSIPMADIVLEMLITTHYKLISVNNGLADFDVRQVFTMKSKITKYDLSAEGKGQGRTLYDIKDRYNREYKMTTDMDMRMKMEEFSMQLKSSTTQIQSTLMEKK